MPCKINLQYSVAVVIGKLAISNELNVSGLNFFNSGSNFEQLSKSMSPYSSKGLINVTYVQIVS